MDLMEMLKAIFNGVNQSADVKLGNLAGGQYVDKNKYDDISRQLETANASLADYDPEWKSKLEQAQAEGDKKLNDYKFEQAVESAINNAGAADLVSVKANLDMSKIRDLTNSLQNLNSQSLSFSKLRKNQKRNLTLADQPAEQKQSQAQTSSLPLKITIIRNKEDAKCLLH